jgi:biopolymer transport protein ExbD
VKISVSRKSFLSLESVAMTDIVMNLFIFFFISFSLLYTFNTQRESKIEVKLPQGQVTENSQGQKGPLVVSVSSGNEIYIQKTRVLPAALKKELQSRAHLAREEGLLVRADKVASVETLVQVLDTAKQAGIAKLGVAIEQAKTQ